MSATPERVRPDFRSRAQRMEDHYKQDFLKLVNQCMSNVQRIKRVEDRADDLESVLERRFWGRLRWLFRGR